MNQRLAVHGDRNLKSLEKTKWLAASMKNSLSLLVVWEYKECIAILYVLAFLDSGKRIQQTSIELLRLKAFLGVT